MYCVNVVSTLYVKSPPFNKEGFFFEFSKGVNIVL